MAGFRENRVYNFGHCTHWLKPSIPPPRIWAHIRGRHWSAKTSISLWPLSVWQYYLAANKLYFFSFVFCGRECVWALPLFAYCIMCIWPLNWYVAELHCKKRFAVLPSPSGKSRIKLPLARNNLIIPGQGEFGVSDIPAGDGKISNLFLQCALQTKFLCCRLRYTMPGCSWWSCRPCCWAGCCSTPHSCRAGCSSRTGSSPSYSGSQRSRSRQNTGITIRTKIESQHTISLTENIWTVLPFFYWLRRLNLTPSPRIWIRPDTKLSGFPESIVRLKHRSGFGHALPGNKDK